MLPVSHDYTGIKKIAFSLKLFKMYAISSGICFAGCSIQKVKYPFNWMMYTISSEMGLGLYGIHGSKEFFGVAGWVGISSTKTG
jgi:hypothetical protein